MSENASNRTEAEILADAGRDETTWGEYIDAIIDETGCSEEQAQVLWDCLGPSEAFDGFVTACQDAAEMEDF